MLPIETFLSVRVSNCKWGISWNDLNPELNDESIRQIIEVHWMVALCACYCLCIYVLTEWPTKIDKCCSGMGFGCNLHTIKTTTNRWQTFQWQIKTDFDNIAAMHLKCDIYIYFFLFRMNLSYFVVFVVFLFHCYK